MSEVKNETAAEGQEKSNVLFTLYLSDLWKGVTKFWWVCIVLAVVAGGFMFYQNYVRFVPLYQTSATFTVSTQNSSISRGGITSYSFYYDTSTASQLAMTFPYILSSNILQESICADLDLPAVPATLSASVIDSSNLFTITVKGRDPQTVYDVLMSAINNFPSAAKHIIGSVELDMMSEAQIPTKPVNSRNYLKQTLLGIAAGVAAGAVWIVVYALLRKTIRTKEDIERAFRLETLVAMPRVSFKKYKLAIDRSVLATNERIGSGFMEALRVFRNTFITRLEAGEKVVMITSTAPGEGKTTVISNLAISLANMGKKVLLIDADLRNPSINGCLGTNSLNTQLLKDTKMYTIRFSDTYSLCILNFKTHENRYWDIMNPDNIKELISKYKEKFDYVLIDTPPCGLISDTMVIAQESDHAIYVILQDTIMASRIKNGIDTLRSAGADIMGCVLNGAQSGFTGYGENYGYGGYGYGSYGGSKYKTYGRYGYGYGYGYGHYGSYGKYGYGYGEEKKSKHRHKHQIRRHKKDKAAVQSTAETVTEISEES